MESGLPASNSQARRMKVEIGAKIKVGIWEGYQVKF